MDDHNTAIKTDGIEATMSPEDRAAWLASLDEAEKGPFISGLKIRAWVESWATEHELPPPEPDLPGR